MALARCPGPVPLSLSLSLTLCPWQWPCGHGHGPVALALWCCPVGGQWPWPCLIKEKKKIADPARRRCRVRGGARVAGDRLFKCFKMSTYSSSWPCAPYIKCAVRTF
ncbi:hypothetical protein T492DRAFT_476486 [Pavlovales sp. CCMP2436]|nr:hypothetical protein T492DRAFT_476486 [Pavlovales sp. CCMP2436]